MRIWNGVILSILILFLARIPICAEVNVAATYDQAISAYKAGSYDQALASLDELEGSNLKQSVRAEVRNLRGIILMREHDYEAAQKTLEQALELAPSLSNAKFNLGEIAFLKRDWIEARRRFERILVEDSRDLESGVRQLISFKVFLTYLLEGNDSVAENLMKSWEQTSAPVYYARAAIAQERGSADEAKEWQNAAKTKFGTETDKLYAESFYELGWNERPASRQREYFEISSATERQRHLEVSAKEVLANVEGAVYAQYLKDGLFSPAESEKHPPDEGFLDTLRPQFLIGQKQLTGTEAPLCLAPNGGPSLAEPSDDRSGPILKSQELAQARDRLEKLFAVATDHRSQQLILYKVFLTFVLEGLDYQAELLRQRFSYTGETPALYYAHAAWAFQHGHSASGNDWVEAAERIYPPELNSLFLDDFYRLGWVDPDGDHISSTRISIGTPMSDTLLFFRPTMTPETRRSPDSTPDPLSQFLTGTGMPQLPSH
jgi:tetratricopeptide (TPR) repeat protein